MPFSSSFRVRGWVDHVLKITPPTKAAICFIPGNGKCKRYSNVTLMGILVAGAWRGDAVAQSISTVSEVVGKWSGVGSRDGKTDLELEPSGKFTLESPLGRQSGMAKIEESLLILPNPNNQGQLKLTKTGDVMEGPYVYGTLNGHYSLGAQKPISRKGEPQTDPLPPDFGPEGRLTGSYACECASDISGWSSLYEHSS